MEFRLLEVVGRLEFVEGLVSEPGFQAAVVPWSILPVLRIGYYAVYLVQHIDIIGTWVGAYLTSGGMLPPPLSPTN